MSRQASQPSHPGGFLAKICDESALSQAQFARMIGVSPRHLPHVIKGTRPVTAELPLLFGHAFEQSPQCWLNLQSVCDLRKAQGKLDARLKQVETLVVSRGMHKLSPL